MGETLQPFTTRFNKSLRVESRAERLTGDAGVVVLREIMERSGIVEWMIPQLTDPRRQEDVIHDLASLIRTSVLLAAQGWRDHDDADALKDDPAFRLAVSSASGCTPLDGSHVLASQPTLSRFTTIMAEPGNLKALREGTLELAARGLRAENGGRRLPRVTLDVDSIPIEVHGHQPKAEWNGHYNARIYHPRITSIAEAGDMLDARLRPGNVGTAEGVRDVTVDVVDRAQGGLCKVAMVRMEAGFPSAALLAGQEARGIDYVARLRANPALDRLAAHYMKRPRGRRPHAPRMWTHVLQYQAESWDKPRRVIRRQIEWSRATGYDGEGIRTIVYGGGPMYAQDIDDALELYGPRFAQIYGQGESPMTITAMNRAMVADRSHPDWRTRRNSVGMAQAAVEVRVVGEDMCDLPPGTPGQILVRGATVMVGYWRNEATTADTLRDGWLCTGDVGHLDGDGFLTLTDRVKDVIISGGSNVYPREVEEVLIRHPEVIEAAVIGVADPEWGERVKAFVVLS